MQDVSGIEHIASETTAVDKYVVFVLLHAQFFSCLPNILKKCDGLNL